MAISVEALRRLLTQPPTQSSADTLKAWRAEQGFSQVEAAIRLGVPLRTLQGWELGRPMQYPGIVQQAQGADRYSLAQSQFAREFAEFIDYVGGDTLQSFLLRVEQKLAPLSPETRSLFGDRYFFHEQCIRFTEGAAPFRLDINDVIAVRTASLIAGVNRVRRSLTARGASRLRSMIIDNLKPDRDIRQLEHEIRCSTHFGRKGLGVKFADLDDSAAATFDLLVTTPRDQIQVECKTVTEDTGSQIKVENTAALSECFRKAVQKQPPSEAGFFSVDFNKPVANCKNLPRQLEDALRASASGHFAADDFTLRFSIRPDWQELLNSGRMLDLRQHVLLDLGNFARCATKVAGKIFAIVFRPHKHTTLNERIVDVIKGAADQCPRDLATMVWLHFVGFAEEEFLALAEFSMAGGGAGLNALVARALHPDASSTDRSHVRVVRFSAEGRKLGTQLAIAPDLMLTNSVSLGGVLYDVQNPRSRFPDFTDL